MNYLAFDIEAANGYKPDSICSVGIVVADENFNILYKTNIWVNPKTAYNLNGTRKNVGIDLHLDKKLLNSSPDFAHVYQNIRDFLTNPQYIVMGHAVDADVRMLNAACKRYRLPSINFRFICTQLLYKLYKGEKDVKALSKIAAELGITYHEHNSEDDAWMSLQTLKYLVGESNLSVEQLLQKYRVRIGSNENFQLVRPVSLEGQVSKKHLTQQAVEKIKAFAQTVPSEGKSLHGNVFCLARSLELSDSEQLYSVLKKIFSNGGRYSSKLAKGNVYLKNSFSSEQDIMRERRVAEMAATDDIAIQTVEEFLQGDCMKNKALEFLKVHKQTAEEVNEQEQIKLFVDDMHKGLCQKGQTIPMIPTYLCNIDRSKIKFGKRILIDAGGTNFRSAVGSFDQNGKAVIEKLRKTTMPASGGEVLSKQQFYDRIAQNIAYLCDDGDDVGFCFSYPVNMASDMDGEVVSFSKEVKAPEVIGTKVGAETLASLAKYSDKPRKIVILNDTVATLLGGMATSHEKFSTYLGYIYGTGTNICCIVDTDKITKVEGLPKGKMLVNMECGGYDKFPMGDFDKAAIHRTDLPNSQLYEKMTSGKYLAEIIQEALCVALKEGYIESAVGAFDLKDVSQFLTEDDGVIYQMLSEKDREFAREVCRQLIKRAAKLGAITNAATASVTCTDKSLPVAVVAEGTTFNRLVGYRNWFEKYLGEYLSHFGITYKIVQGEELNLVGTLMATMVL